MLSVRRGHTVGQGVAGVATGNYSKNCLSADRSMSGDRVVTVCGFVDVGSNSHQPNGRQHFVVFDRLYVTSDRFFVCFRPRLRLFPVDYELNIDKLLVTENEIHDTIRVLGI